MIRAIISKKAFVVALFFVLCGNAMAGMLLIPMDNTQRDHLKSYGIAYWAVEQGLELKWLLNYRGGSFLLDFSSQVEQECRLRGVSYEAITNAKCNAILAEIARPDVNQDAVAMVKAPRIAVYSPPNKQPWDDAVTLVLTYAQIPYDIVYDEDVLIGKLSEYEWLHLHHEDFTGQYGKFYRSYNNMPWYQQEVLTNEAMAKRMGYKKVSEMKNAVTQSINKFVEEGGFMFAMCAATDTYDISLASTGLDVIAEPFDHDPINSNDIKKIDYNKTIAFTDFKISTDPMQYEFSDIDVTDTRKVNKQNDYFSLFEFSAKWDPIPTMLCQNHEHVIRGFMGQTTAFRKSLVKKSIIIMGENKDLGEVRYLHGDLGKGFFSFYGGHDPEDYSHFVGDKHTDLSLYPNSPGYRLILNNILFPAAKKKKRKT
ncbi:MAG: asparagine synthetase B [Bacteroidales bacterium]